MSEGVSAWEQYLQPNCMGDQVCCGMEGIQEARVLFLVLSSTWHMTWGKAFSLSLLLFPYLFIQSAYSSDRSFFDCVRCWMSPSQYWRTMTLNILRWMGRSIMIPVRICLWSANASGLSCENWVVLSVVIVELLFLQISWLWCNSLELSNIVATAFLTFFFFKVRADLRRWWNHLLHIGLND